jgi:hypothetical protein
LIKEGLIPKFKSFDKTKAKVKLLDTSEKAEAKQLKKKLKNKKKS